MLALILTALFKAEPKEEGEDPGVADITYPFAQDIVGNTISADLMDYLTRDHRFTGLPAALGHRFLDSCTSRLTTTLSSLAAWSYAWFARAVSAKTRSPSC
jgi:HD superfamily phosphohydrolase